MLGPPLSSAGSRAELSWPAGLFPRHSFPALRAEPFRYMGQEFCHGTVKTIFTVFLFLHLPPPFP
jgi:hypothetical protein